ncbi:MAG: hypothetical protein FWD73_11930 [Polyangiaceae bacterium]|nr:hypothetical protein [Polyangiaceae bacterium]
MRGCLVLLSLFSLAAVGCGRKATREDCEVVVDRNVEIQLKAQGVIDPAVIDKEKQKILSSMSADIDKCVGMHVTDSMISCMKNAPTAEQVDKCLR